MSVGALRVLLGRARTLAQDLVTLDAKVHMVQQLRVATRNEIRDTNARVDALGRDFATLQWKDPEVFDQVRGLHPELRHLMDHRPVVHDLE